MNNRALKMIILLHACGKIYLTHGVFMQRLKQACLQFS